MQHSDDEPATALAPHQRVWLGAFDEYAQHYPEERASVELFRQFVSAHADAAERHLAIGHLTGSAWLVSADGARVLLTHHRKLNRWLQLGGHADGDHDLARAALREAEEESGLRDLVVDPMIFDLDRHEIPAHIPVVSPHGPASPSVFAPGEHRPARGNEMAHWHYDVRFIVHASGSEEFAISDESHALAWRVIAELVEDPTADESLRRMARKWQTSRNVVRSP